MQFDLVCIDKHAIVYSAVYFIVPKLTLITSSSDFDDT